jgi:aspartate-semialdehyde dehydrogenase
MRESGYTVAVVGATGLVGSEIVRVLGERQFPLADLRLYASPRTAGDTMQCGPCSAPVELLDSAHLEDVDIVFLAAGETVSAGWVGRATEAGAVVIDLSQLFAGDPDVPLVVPEVNPAAVEDYATRFVIASPDTAALALAVVLKPLQDTYGVERLVAVVLEPVSSAGRAGITELERQTFDLMSGRSPEHEQFARRVAFNLVPQTGALLAGGASSHEQQAVAAVRRLLAAPDLPVHMTRVYVPLFFGTALAVSIATSRTASAEEVSQCLRAAPGVLLEDEGGEDSYRTTADTVGLDSTCVGRLRVDPADGAIDLWITIDNIRKGSAVNAVQIAEVLVREYL